MLLVFLFDSISLVLLEGLVILLNWGLRVRKWSWRLHEGLGRCVWSAAEDEVDFIVHIADTSIFVVKIASRLYFRSYFY